MVVYTFNWNTGKKEWSSVSLRLAKLHSENPVFKKGRCIGGGTEKKRREEEERGVEKGGKGERLERKEEEEE